MLVMMALVQGVSKQRNVPGFSAIYCDRFALCQAVALFQCFDGPALYLQRSSAACCHENAQPGLLRCRAAPHWAPACLALDSCCLDAVVSEDPAQRSTLAISVIRGSISVDPVVAKAIMAS